jgi:hypothetical protein
MTYRTSHRPTTVSPAHRKLETIALSPECVAVGTVARPESRYAGFGR